MKLVGILTWYEESPAWLAGCVASMANQAGIDHLVAVDGAYALLPGGRPYSGLEQHEVIWETCRACQIGVTLYAPQEVWLGNEVEKRSFGFQLAEQHTDGEQDWYFLMDADQVVTSALGLRRILEDTELDVGETWFTERYDPHENDTVERIAGAMNWPRESRLPVRCIFRALPRLHVAENHYTYMTGNGRVLWTGDPQTLPAVDTRVEIEHRTRLRDLARKEQQQAYYRRRDELGVERVLAAEVIA